VKKRAPSADSLPLEGRPRWRDAFLSGRTCAWILDELEIALWRPSTVVAKRPDGSFQDYHSANRLSETAHEQWFSPALRRELRRIEKRIAAVLDADVSRFEEWQASLYRRGGKFDFHFDSGYWGHEPAGERAKTALIFLNTPGSGGGTRFQELRIEVDARAGRLLTWDNLLPNGERDPRMLHAGVPVTRGTKTVLVTWIRQNAVRPTRQEVFYGQREGHHPKNHPEARRDHRSERETRSDDRDSEKVPIRGG
jgi:prolyl 4-hydroxylase